MECKGSAFLSSKTRMVLACIIVAASAFLFIGARSVWSTDEGRYTAVALQMMRSGDWMHPGFNTEEPHFTKPPVTYWALAASMSISGVNETAARLPGAIAFALTCIALGLIASSLAPGAGPAGAAAYAVTVFPFVASNIITTDTILTMWETLAMLAFVKSWPALDAGGSGIGAKPRRGWLWAMWLAFGGAFMTKGPPGLVFIPAFVVSLRMFGGWRAALRMFDPVGLLIFAVTGFWWYAVIIFGDPEMGSYFIVEEVYNRMFTGAHHRNSQWYKSFMYLGILAGGMLPWTAVWVVVRPWWSWGGGRFIRGERGPVRVFLGLSAFLPLVVFMLAKSRLPLYVLPLGVPLVVATVLIVEERYWKMTRAWVLMVAMVVLLCTGRAIGGAIKHGKDMKTLTENLTPDGKFDEVVFVDRRPKYGIAFYSGTYCEEVTLLDTKKGKETLKEELEDYEVGKTILIVSRPDIEADILDLLESSGWTVHERIQYLDFLAFYTENQQSTTGAAE